MIILNPQGGLCNRLRVIGSAIKLGIDYDDSITVFWKMNPELGCAFEDLFAPIMYHGRKGRLDLRSVDIPEDELLFEIKGNIKNGRSYIDTADDVRRFQQDYINSNGKGDFLVSTCQAFYDFTGGYGWLLPQKEILAEIESISQKFGKHGIGLHIRRTDNEMAKWFSPTELFVQAAKNEVKKNSDTKFYLATDDMEVKKYFFDVFGERIITSYRQSFARENKEGMLSAVVDLYALSRTQKIYGSYWSSFSSAAASIGNVEVEYVRAKPMEKLLNKRVVIYGAGQLGRAIYWGYVDLCNIVGWADRDYKRLSDAINMEIISPETISKLNFDYIIIAVKDYGIKREVKQLLLSMNIKPDMIIEDL